jgi:hypothetical protein
MKRTMFRLLALAAAIAAAPSIASAAEEATVKAFVAWEGAGNTTQTGVDEATFIGAIAGTVYVETDKGPIDSGQLVCPVMVQVELSSGSQKGSGRCTLTAQDGMRIYGAFTCSGIHLVGCDGDFTLTGGTGRFEGITGGGRAVLRAGQRTITAVGESGITETGNGILFWQALSYKLP